MFEQLLRRVTATLSKYHIQYVLIGGHAANFYGEVRFTKDIDFIVGVGLEGVEELLATIQEVPLSPLADDPLSFALSQFYLRTRDDETQIVVDFLFASSDYHRSLIARAKVAHFGSTPVLTATAEDIILLKSMAGRPRDWDDVRNILLRNSNLSLGYIEKWLAMFDSEADANQLAEFKQVLSQLNKHP